MAERNIADEAPADTATDLEPLSCVSCRARKLKCDRTKPACTRCLKVNADCEYPESRRKPTFKRKNVEELEARLAQVEGMLKDINGKEPGHGSNEDMSVQGASLGEFSINYTSELPREASSAATDTFSQPDSDGWSRSRQNGSQLIGLGMSEALPPLDIMEALNNVFFSSSYHMVPVVHSGRYLAAFYGDPLRRPSMCLQYAIWALASHGHPKYDFYSDLFYRRSRHYIQADEMRDDGEHFITLNHAQTWVILSTYEAKRMLFTRAAMSCSRCVRICQMMGLDRLDGGVDDLPPALGPVRSWVELEERRRVFWGAFAIDSHSSISTGWPYLINADNVITRLPASEAAFSSGEEEAAAFLHQVFEGATYAGFAGTVVVCEIYKSILRHVHRPKPDDNPEDLEHGGFWKRHRELDNQLSSVFMFLPEQFQLPAQVRNPGAVHVNLNLHASIICLHHAALELAEKYNHPQSLIQASKSRLRTSAEEVVNIVKMTAHRTSMFKSPMCAISMYCATTVYVYLTKTDPLKHISPVDVSSLEVVIHAMEAISRSHEITKALLLQACHDIDQNGLGSKIRFPALTKYRDAAFYSMAQIPLLARSPISRHAEILPILPGRLPLENPRGHALDLVSRGTESTVRKLIGTDCFQSVMGAVTRNVAGPPQQPTVIDITDTYTPKRKRTSASPAPPSMDASTGFIHGATAPDNPMDLNSWKTGPHSLNSIFSLPDRSSPSNASSPAQNIPGTGAGTGSVSTVDAQMDPFAGGTTTTASSSSSSIHKSPGAGTVSTSGVGSSTIFGLGNTPEENRIDLRMFQDRVVAPTWSSEEEMFAAQIAGSLAANGEIPGGISMPWNLFNGDIPPWGRS